MSERTTRALLLALALLFATLAAFLPSLNNGFVDFDDSVYITANPTVLKGMTWQGVGWAFTEVHANNWHPLTWISHMADVQLFGVRPLGHHLVSLLIHAAAAALLLLTLVAMTQQTWPSAFAAALFALHPLRVESVAWASERKDVLAVFFWVCTMASYTWYARKPSLWRYVAVAACFTLGLLAKPLLVTLPFALLLLDGWPLRRVKAAGRESGDEPPPFPGVSMARAGAEKLPLLALAVLSSAATYLIQQRTGAVSAGDILPLPLRAANAATAYVVYLAKTLWPARLSVLYLHPEKTLAAGIVAGCLALLVAATLLAVRQRFRRPYLAVGWFWYLGTLVPMIGFVQVGLQGLADRYTYIPAVGLGIAAAWGARDLGAALKIPPRVLAAAGVALLLALGTATHLQVGYWRDTLTLFTQALAVSPGNWFAHNKVGEELVRRGDNAGALRHFRESVRLKPVYAEARFNLGNALVRAGETAAAEEHFRKATLHDPAHAAAWNQLGLVLFELGRIDEAETRFARAATLQPGFFEAFYNRGLALERLGRYRTASR